MSKKSRSESDSATDQDPEQFQIIPASVIAQERAKSQVDLKGIEITRTVELDYLQRAGYVNGNGNGHGGLRNERNTGHGRGMGSISQDEIPLQGLGKQ